VIQRSADCDTLPVLTAELSPRVGTIRPRIDPHETFQQTKTFSALNGLRCVCALGVLKAHCEWVNPTLRFLNHGYLGVDVFFVISGFLIVTLLLREKERFGDIHLGKFFARRALRIFPIYYAMIFVVLLAFLAVAPWKPSGFRFYLPISAVLMTYTTDIISLPALGLFFHCWSLAMEEQFYLVWPAIEKFLSTAVKWGLLGLGLVLSQLVNFGVFGDLIDRVYGRSGARLMPMYMVTFTPIILGVVLAHLLHHRRSFSVLYRLLGHRWSCLVVLAAIVAIAQNLGHYYQGFTRGTLQLLFMLGLAAVVIREDHWLRRILSFPLFVRIGSISYGIYLYHVVVLDLLTKGSHNALSPPVTFLILTPLTLGVAELSYRYFEHRFLSLRRKFEPRGAESSLPGRIGEPALRT